MSSVILTTHLPSTKSTQPLLSMLSTVSHVPSHRYPWSGWGFDMCDSLGKRALKGGAQILGTINQPQVARELIIFFSFFLILFYFPTSCKVQNGEKSESPNFLKAVYFLLLFSWSVSVLFNFGAKTAQWRKSGWTWLGFRDWLYICCNRSCQRSS